MSGEQKTHTIGEVDLLVATARVETMQCMLNDSFNDHKKDDEVHFKNLYEADKQILAEISLIPERIATCSERIKTDVLKVARNEFSTIVNFEVFKAKIVTWGIAAGIIAGVVAKIIDWALKLAGVK